MIFQKKNQSFSRDFNGPEVNSNIAGRYFLVSMIHHTVFTSEQQMPSMYCENDRYYGVHCVWESTVCVRAVEGLK